MAKRHQSDLYLFAAGMRDGRTTATFSHPQIPPGARVEVLDENRQLSSSDGGFQDTFTPWAVHLYKITVK
jgi:hypothetical protein